MSAPYASLGVKFCPTGGVTPNNMFDYLAMPEVFAVGGTRLATQRQIQKEGWYTITRQVKDALRQAKGGMT